MPTFPSPDPISITIDILGNTHITASDRTDTVITVGPRDPSKSSDVKAAEQTVVDYSDGRLFVKSPRSWGPFSGSQTVVVTLELPTGSTLDGTSPMGGSTVTLPKTSWPGRGRADAAARVAG